MLLDECDEIRGRISGQRRFAEVRVLRQEVVRSAMQIGEIATPAAGDEDLFADAIGVLQHGGTAATFTGFDGTHQAGGPAAENDYVEGLLDQVTSFKFRVSSFKSKVKPGVEKPNGLKSVRENVCCPYGTRIYFPLTQHFACGCVLGLVLQL